MICASGPLPYLRQIENFISNADELNRSEDFYQSSFFSYTRKCVNLEDQPSDQLWNEVFTVLVIACKVSFDISMMVPDSLNTS